MVSPLAEPFVLLKERHSGRHPDAFFFHSNLVYQKFLSYFARNLDLIGLLMLLGRDLGRQQG